MNNDSYDVIVVGAGAAGLTAAAGCALFGLRTALIERDRMGGECLNTGCVPSKLVRAEGRPVGVTIASARIGEMLLPWTLVLGGKASRFALAGAVVAYPTRSERSKAAAFEGLRSTAFHPALKRWARLLAWRRRRGARFAQAAPPG